jgi:hypothetical protein
MPPNVWVGTFTGGLQLLKKAPAHLKSISYDLQNPKSVSSNNISCIFEDDKHVYG